MVRRGPKAWGIDGGDGLLLGLLLGSLVPIWAFRYFPTQDGPSHLENALVVKHLLLGGGALSDLYALNSFVVPNWTSHLALASLMAVFPPLTAEKVFLTAYVVFFVGAFRYLVVSVDPSAKLLTLLALPFAHNLLLYAGFYNFCLGIPLSFVILAYTWTALPSPKPLRFALVLNLLLVVLYYCHVVSHTLALLSVVILALVRTRCDLRKTGLVVLALLPTAALTLRFLVGFGGGGEVVSRWGLGESIVWVAQLSSLTPYAPGDGCHIGKLVVALFVLLAILTVVARSRAAAGEGRRWIWRPEDAFLGLSAGLGAVYLLAPDSVGSGSSISFRLALFPPLALIPWLRLPSTDTGRRAFALAASLILVIHLGLVLQHSGRTSAGLREYTAGMDVVEPGETLLPITATVKGGDSDTIAIYLHAASYYALEAGAINLANYEAGTDYFPVLFRPGWDPYRELGDGWVRGTREFDPQRYPRPIDILLVWGATQPFAGAVDVLRYYEPVFVGDRLVLFRRVQRPAG